MSGQAPVPRFRLVQGRVLGERLNTPTPNLQAAPSPGPSQETPQQLVQVQHVQQAHHSATAPNLINITALTPPPGTPQAANPQPARPPSIQDERGAVIKCIRFLRTLIKLSHNESSQTPQQIATQHQQNMLVRELVGCVLFGEMTAEEFTRRLQEALHSQAQPHLLPFLQNTLPALRTAVRNREVSIDGIVPPPGFVFNATPPGAQPPQQGAPVQSSPATPQAPVARVIPPPQPQMHMQPPQQPSTLVARLNTPVQQPVQFATPTTQVRQIPVAQMVTSSGQPIAAMPPGNVQMIQSSQQPATSQQHFMNEDVFMQPIREEEPTTMRVYADHSLKSSFLQPNEIMNRFTRRMKESCYIEEDVITLISDATEYRLRELLTEVACIAEHRVDALRSGDNYVPVDDTRRQLRFLEDFDRQEEEMRENREKETLIRLSKSKNSGKDTIEKAKEMQRADAEAKRNRDANAAAIAALSGNRQVRKWEGTTGASNVQRPRTVRINTRDLHLLVNSDSRFANSFLREKLAYCGPVVDTI